MRCWVMMAALMGRAALAGRMVAVFAVASAMSVVVAASAMVVMMHTRSSLAGYDISNYILPFRTREAESGMRRRRSLVQPWCL
jgi:hypothetical protein